MVLTELYQIDGKALVAPDAQVQMSFEDIDGAQSGRDEAGYMHRIVVRRKVGVWEFSYSCLSRQAYQYMMSVLPTGGSFQFTHPDRNDSSRPARTTAYLSRYSVVWHDAATDSYRNLKFSIIEC